MIKQSPYEILGLKDDFSFKDIKKAYRVAIRNNTPEQNPQEFAKISDAYDMLTNENYFLSGVKDNSFTLSIDKKIDDSIKSDNSFYLKKIFETPFIS
ncbi:MAG: DnaJ domain-containing protein [Campylobacterota bacterium]|nr:DnaJ domain-containing protein [Campylobacterota bacterium]